MMIGKYIEMSTAHLTESTMQRLEADEIDDAHPVTDEYGAYLPVSDILKNSNTIPSDLKECVDYAARNDVSLIRFDRDVDLIAGLTALFMVGGNSIYGNHQRLKNISH